MIDNINDLLELSKNKKIKKSLILKLKNPQQIKKMFYFKLYYYLIIHQIINKIYSFYISHISFIFEKINKYFSYFIDLLKSC